MAKESIYNFSAGPAVLPREVMLEAQREFVDFQGTGFGLVEASHRGSVFRGVLERAEWSIRQLLSIGDDYAVLFLQGGASLQFAMVPLNILFPGQPALYADTGAWSSKAITECRRLGEAKVIYDGSESDYTRIGEVTEWEIDSSASYVYICANNTIYGTEYHFFPETGDVPLVADMSSDIMSREIEVSNFGIIFAGAQKNMGPAGVTLVVIRKDLAERVPDAVPAMLKYTTHIEKDSSFNTPPTFGIYMVGLVAEWLLEQGGIPAIQKINQTKSQALYETIDGSDFYRGTAEPGDRSKMNVCFRLPNEDLEARFITEAAEAGLLGLKGHRSVGGMRASIYNAMPMAGVSTLIDFMTDFEEKRC